MSAGFDVVVAGTGNAALTAALSASEGGAKVLLVEVAPEDQVGGNSRYTFGCFRVAFSQPNQLQEIFPDLSQTDFELLSKKLYTPDYYFSHLMSASDHLADKELCRMLVEQSYPTISWMRKLGIVWRFPGENNSIMSLPKDKIDHLEKLNKQNQEFYKKGNLFTGSNTLTKAHVFAMMSGVEAKGGGPGLIEMLLNAVRKNNIPIYFNTGVDKLLTDSHGQVIGVRVKTLSGYKEIKAKNVILACGGFEANPKMRAEYLGPTWATMKVRGTRYNMGEGLRIALEIGAQPYGGWAGAHAVPIDANAGSYGDLVLGERTRRCLFQLGIMVNKDGKRFIDEGEDLMPLMYAKVGIAVESQSHRIAYQVFDSKWLDAPIERDFYFLGPYIKADTLEELADKMEIDKKTFLEEVNAYNSSIDENVPFNPFQLDRRSAKGAKPPRSNYAIKLETPPYWAFKVSGGMTFTYGGIKINTNSQVLDLSDRVIPGLFAAGEMAGGFFYHTYPGGAGLMRGAVTGYIAGKAATRS